MDKSILNKKDTRFYSVFGGVLFIIVAVLFVLGEVPALVRLQSAFYKKFVITLAVDILTALSYVFIGITLFIKRKGLSVLGLGILTFAAMCSLVVDMALGSYTKFLVLLVDIILFLLIGMVFGLVSDANRVRRAYTPPKNRYTPIIIYPIMGVLKRVLLIYLAGKKYSFWQNFAQILTVVLVAAALFCAVQIIVRPIVPIVSDVYLEKKPKYDNWHGKTAKRDKNG